MGKFKGQEAFDGVVEPQIEDLTRQFDQMGVESYKSLFIFLCNKEYVVDLSNEKHQPFFYPVSALRGDYDFNVIPEKCEGAIWNTPKSSYDRSISDAEKESGEFLGQFKQEYAHEVLKGIVKHMIETSVADIDEDNVGEDKDNRTLLSIVKDYCQDREFYGKLQNLMSGIGFDVDSNIWTEVLADKKDGNSPKRSAEQAFAEGGLEEVSYGASAADIDSYGSDPSSKRTKSEESAVAVNGNEDNYHHVAVELTSHGETQEIGVGYEAMAPSSRARPVNAQRLSGPARSPQNPSADVVVEAQKEFGKST